MCNSNDVSLTKSLRLWRVELCFAEQAEQQQLVRMLGSVDVTDHDAPLHFLSQCPAEAFVN